MTRETIETRIAQLEALSPGTWEIQSVDIHDAQAATADELLWLNNARTLYLSLAAEALALYDQIDTMEWRDQTLDFTVVNVKATLDLPNEADVLRRARRDIIMERLDVEAASIEAAFPETLSRKQYDRRRAVIAKLRTQVQTLYETNLPGIAWSSV